MSEFDNCDIDGSNTEGGGHYQLDVDINQIAFSHDLLSRECVSGHVKLVLVFCFDSFQALMSEFDNRYIDGSNTEGGGHYQLDVDINQIAFSHHHLYSREHVLAQRLTQLFEQYVVRQKKNMTEYLGEKVSLSM